MSILRVTSRLVGLLWVLLLAALALGLALYCLDGLVGLGRARPDRLLHLITARRETGRFLAQLQAPGPVAILSLLCGLGAVLAGLVLLRGILARPRERLAVLDDDASGKLAAQRRAMTQILRNLASAAREVSEVKHVRVSLRRGGTRGRVKLQTIPVLAGDPAVARSSIEGSLAPVTKPFRLQPRISMRPAENGGKRAS